MNGWFQIFEEPPIKCTPGVFQRHPRTGTACGLVHWSRVRISHSASDEDVKFIWELNRLSALDSLLACAVIDNQEMYLHKACSLVRQWRAENPFKYGINWFSTMEAALRLLRLLLLRGLLKEFQCHTSEVDIAVVEHYSHVVSQWPFTVKTMMAGNHLLVELAALAAYEFMTASPGLFYQRLTQEAEKQFFFT